MYNYTFIVFGHSGLYLSKLLKECNPKLKIIHFHDRYFLNYSSADIKVATDINFDGIIEDEHTRYELVSEDKKFDEATNSALKEIEKAILFDDIEAPLGIYPIILDITKKLIKRNVECHNIFFKPYSFFGKRKANHYDDFYKEITSIKNNNHYFTCDDLNKYNIKHDSVINLFRLIDMIQFNISFNLEKNINSIIRNTIKEKIPNIELQKTTKEYCYVSVIYDDDIVAKTIKEPSFYYKTDLKEIQIDDRVLVDRNGKEVVAIVIDKMVYAEDDVPFPLEKTKNIIKILDMKDKSKETKKELLYIDSCDEYMLIINESNNIDNNLGFYRSFIVEPDSPNMEELIDKCSIIIAVGDVNISKYDLSSKYVININNENNYGRHTAISYLSNEHECIQMIRTINYGLFVGGFITIDLHDIEFGINGKIQYKRYSIKDKEKIFKDFNVINAKKIFIIFEAPTDSNLYEICDIVDEIREGFNECELYFGVPVMERFKELMINVFYEGNE